MMLSQTLIRFSIPLLAAIVAGSLAFFTWRRLNHKQRGIRSPSDIALLDRMQDGIILLNEQNHILYVNPAAQAILGVKAVDTVGSPVARLLRNYPNLVAHCYQNSSVCIRLTLDIDQTLCHFDTNVIRLQNPNGRLIGRLVIMHDVTASDARLSQNQESLLLAREQITALARTNDELGLRLEERSQAEAELVQRNRELLSLQSAAAATVSSLDLAFVLETVTWEMVNLLGVESCAVSEWCQEADTLSVIAEYGVTSWLEEVASVKSCPLTDYSLKAQALSERCAQQITISQAGPETPEFGEMQEAGISSLLLLPMVFQTQTIGLVEIADSRAERTFTDHEISLAQVLANQAAAAVQNARLYERAQHEIAERKRAEELLKDSLKEKELLLKEIHHRVKNNLQVVSSLLNLQAQESQDAATLDLFQESQNRILSMALIHEKLYRSRDLARIDLAEYIRTLATELVSSYRAQSGPVILKIDAAAVFLSIDKAVPCGLILNELIANALKHAFPDYPGPNQENRVLVELASTPENLVTLVVADNGIGFPEDLEFQTLDSLGLRLINTLVNQLEGTLEMKNQVGTQFKLTFTGS